MVEVGPPSVDHQDIQFKLHSKLKLFSNTDESIFKNSTNLLAVASKYGLVFVGTTNSTLEILQIKSVENTTLTKTESSNFPKRTVQLAANASHLATNCDQSLLAVVCSKNDCATAILYNIPSFLSQNLVIVREIRLSSTPGVSILETSWNPTIPGIYTACKEDGSLGVYTIQENSVDINELPSVSAARCFCWSPKGKQLVVGALNGTLTQYKPDLKAVKIIQAPNFNTEGSFSVLNVYWITNYQFIAVYYNANNEEPRPNVLVVNAPKTGPPTYLNYDDICFSYKTLRPPQYYFIHQSNWNVILVASGNSIEVGVLGVIQSGDPAIWQQWIQNDYARAELPLTAKHQEMFPVGIAFDTGITYQVPYGENKLLPPMPMLHVLSHYGILCSFIVMNVKEGVENLCIPPEITQDLSGLSLFTVEQPKVLPQTPVPQPTTTVQVQPKEDLVIKYQPIFSSATASTSPAIVKPTAQTANENLFGNLNKSPFSVTTAEQTQISLSSIFSNNLPSQIISTTQEASTTKSITVVTSVPPTTPKSSGLFGSSLTGTSSFGSTNISTVKTFTTLPSVLNQTQPVATNSVLSQKNDSSLINKDDSFSNDKMTCALIEEEEKAFRKELLSLLQLCKTVKLFIGTEDEMAYLAVSIDNLVDFFKELQEITDTQTSEFKYLYNLTMQSYSWYENSKMRYMRFKDKSFTNYIEKQGLDPVSEKQLSDIKHLVYYIESQLRQIDGFLDTQWENFQDSCKVKIKGRLKIPTLEPIYQSLVKEHEIIQRQQFLIKDISMRNKSRKKKSLGVPNAMNIVSVINEEPLDIDIILQKLEIDSPDISSSICQQIKKQKKKYTDNLKDKYRNFYTNRTVIYSTQRKPKFADNFLEKSLKLSSPAQKNLSQFVNTTDFNYSAEANISSINLLNFDIDAQNIKLRSPGKPLFTANIQSNNKTNTPTTLASTLNFASPIIDNKQVSFKLPESTKVVEIDSPYAKDTMKFSSQSNNIAGELSTKPTSNIFTVPRESLDSGFSFVKPLIPVQQSTPKSKASPISVTQTSTSGITKFLTSPTQITVATPTTTEFSFINTLNANKLESSISLSTTTPVFETAKTVQQTPSALATSNIFGGTANKSLIQQSSKISEGTSNKSLNQDSQSVESLSNIFGGAAIKSSSQETIVTASNIFAGATIKSLSQDTTSSSNIFGDVTIKNLNQETPSTASVSNIFSGIPIKNSTQETANAVSTSNIFGGTSVKNLNQETPSTVSTSNILGGTTIKSLSQDTPTTVTTSNIFASTTIKSPSQETPSTVNTLNIFEGTINKNLTTQNQSNIFGSANTNFSSIFGGKSEKLPEFSFTAALDQSTSNSAVSTTTTSNQNNSSSTSDKVATTDNVETTNQTNNTAEKPVEINSALMTAKEVPKVSKPEQTKNLFSGVAATTPIISTASSNIFGGTSNTNTSAVTANTFSFIQTASEAAFNVNNVSTSAETPNVSLVFTSPSAAKSVETVDTKPKQDSSTFSFETMGTAVSPVENKFSFGNLTISALSPSTTTNTANTTVPASTTSAFSFNFCASTTTTTITTSNSVFGGFGSSLFGKPAAVSTTTSSFMGQSICSPSAFNQQNTGNVFGQSTGNIFATKPVTTAASGSIFGQPNNSGSIFGASTVSPTATSTASSSIFGQTPNSPFGSPVASTANANLFGQSSTFATANTSGSLFGQSAFGTSATSTPSSNFSFTQTAQQSSFGTSGGNIFGAKSTFGQAPAFGQPPSFGSPSTFGSSPVSGGNIFGSPAATNTGSTFGSSFGSPSAFGQKPSFGSSPTFGQSAFGSPPAFGAAPAFGNPQRLFGATSPTTGTFGANVQENSTFANLANQSTVGFGSLVQNQPAVSQPQQPQFSGGAQFSSWR